MRKQRRKARMRSINIKPEHPLATCAQIVAALESTAAPWDEIRFSLTLRGKVNGITVVFQDPPDNYAYTRREQLMFDTKKALRRQLAQARARLHMIDVTIAREITTEFEDDPRYQKGYRDALKMIARVPLNTGTRRRVTGTGQARQSSTTHRTQGEDS